MIQAYGVRVGNYTDAQGLTKANDDEENGENPQANSQSEGDE